MERVLLKEDNYLEWTDYIRNELLARGLWNIVLGIKERPRKPAVPSLRRRQLRLPVVLKERVVLKKMKMIRSPDPLRRSWRTRKLRWSAKRHLSQMRLSI
jgi:hypothetical protein